MKHHLGLKPLRAGYFPSLDGNRFDSFVIGPAVINKGMEGGKEEWSEGGSYLSRDSKDENIGGKTMTRQTMEEQKYTDGAEIFPPLGLL